MSDTENTAVPTSDAVEALEETVKTTKPIRPKRASVAAKKRKASESEEEDAYEEAGEDEEDAPAPKKKAKTTPAKKATGKTTKAGTQTTLAAKSKDTDPFSITLDGDDNETVPILDSCDELRKKINVYLDTSGQNKTAFLRDIARAGWPKNPPKIQSKQLTDFQTKKGPTAGNTSKVCYGAYVYFEKLRIAKGENKSRHRNGMEKQWGADGLPRSAQRGIWCAPGERPVVNAYGGVSFK